MYFSLLRAYFKSVFYAWSVFWLWNLKISNLNWIFLALCKIEKVCGVCTCCSETWDNNKKVKTRKKMLQKMKSLWIHLLFIAVSSNTGRICLFITTFHDSWNLVFIFWTKISLRNKYVLGWLGFQTHSVKYIIFRCVNQGRRKVHDCILVILAAQPGLNGRISCLHSLKIFWPMKPSYTSNEMT